MLPGWLGVPAFYITYSQNDQMKKVGPWAALLVLPKCALKIEIRSKRGVHEPVFWLVFLVAIGVQGIFYSLFDCHCR